MGLFPSTQIFVASTSCNLAGPPEVRPSFLKTTIIANTALAGTKRTVAENLATTYLTGPGTRMRRFFNWAQDPTHYDLVGLPTETISGVQQIDYAALHTACTDYYSVPAGGVYIQAVEAGPALYTWWAEQWMLENHKSEFDSAWFADMGENSDEITITRADNAGTYTFTPTNFDKKAKYLYCFFLAKSVAINRYYTYIYKFGSGNAALDAILDETEDVTHDYYPFIPLRSGNTFLSELYNPDVFAQAKAAYKKATGGKLSKLIDQVKTSESLDDIDYAYVVFGIAPNTKDNKSRSYLYAHFKRFMQLQFGDGSAYDQFKVDYAAYRASVDAWVAWHDAGETGVEPEVEDFPSSVASGVRVRSNGAMNMELDFEIQWKFIDELTGTGLKKPDAHPGEYWFEVNPTDEYAVPLFGNVISKVTDSKRVDIIRLHHQVDADNWRSLLIVGMVHRNYVYRGKYVEIGLKEAIQDPEDSGFIVPLHKPTMDAMGMIGYTQLAVECSTLVLNCFVVKKVTLLGALLGFLTIVIMIAIIAYAPQAAPGLLGSNAAVGAALGLSGALAVIVGAIANAIAAMIVMKLFVLGATAIFGDKIGAIIGAIAGYVAISVGSGLMNGQSMSSIWASMGSATNLLQLTNAIGSGVTGYIKASMDDLNAEMETFNKKVDEKLSELQQAYADNIGYGNALLDPMSLTESPLGNWPETPSLFLNRTLLTGSEVADISMSMISGFSDITLSTDLPGQ